MFTYKPMTTAADCLINTRTALAEGMTVIAEAVGHGVFDVLAIDLRNRSFLIGATDAAGAAAVRAEVAAHFRR